jgi:hypothetical protein
MKFNESFLKLLNKLYFLCIGSVLESYLFLLIKFIQSHLVENFGTLFI